MAELDLMATEHERGLHRALGVQPYTCSRCWPTGAPPLPPVTAAAAPAADTPADRRRQRGDGFEPLAAAMLRFRERIVVDQPPDAEPDANLAADGYPRCEVCKSFRRVVLDVPDRYDPRLGQSIDCPACLPYRQAERLERFLGSAPEFCRELTLETFPTWHEAQQKALGLAHSWVDAPRGPSGECWSVLHGRAGRGKTGLAVASTRARRGRSAALYAHVPRLLTKIQSTYDRERSAADPMREAEVLESLGTVDVLVLDDLGAEAPTAWAEQRIYQVLDARSGDPRLVTIVTTNYSPLRLLDRIGRVDPESGERIVSRLLGRAGPYVIEVGGPDLRLTWPRGGTHG